MSPKAASNSLTSMVTRIGGVVVPVLIAIYLIFSQANFLIGRSLLIAFGETESTYKGASLEWDGDVVAKDFVLYPYDVVDESTAIRFERVHLETPGWFWFLRNTFDRKLRRAHLDRLHLTLTGGETSAGIDPSLGDLGPFGGISASPFEAEGCMQDSLWTRDELVTMGLSPEPTTLEFDYRVERGELLTTVILETRGASRVQMDRIGSLPGETNMLLLDTFFDETRSERWEIQDQGFVAARNRFCAKKDKVEPLRFVDRHVESVVRLMDTLGVSVDRDSRTTYRRFARDGGKLIYSIVYPKALPAEMLYDLREHPGVLSTSNATLDHNGKVSTIRWEKFDPIPLAGLDEGEPTFAALQKERASSLRGDTMAGADANPSTTPADAAAATAATTTTAGSEDTVEALIASRTGASNAAATAPTAEAAASAEAETAPSASATTPAAATPTPATASPPVAETTPALAATPSPETAAAAAPAPSQRPGTKLQWTDLMPLQGRLVRIWTVHNPPRLVEILDTSDGMIRVKTRVGGGNGEYTIQRQAFLKATLVR